MPEYKEEVGPFEALDSESADVENETDDKVGEDEHVHYTLKRGRIPMKKKNAAQPSKNEVGEVDVSAVRVDAIGVGGSSKNKSHCSKKSTEVVDKGCKKPTCGCGAQKSKMAKKDEKCADKTCCKCGFFKKILCFLGLCKKSKEPEKQVRSYRHRNHNQRRRRPQNGTR